MPKVFQWMLSVMLLVVLQKPVAAWVEEFQPFPEGEATVVMDPYCRAGACSYYLGVTAWGTAI